MEYKAPVYGGKSPRLWGKPLFMGILKNKGFLKSPRLWGERPPFMGILKNKSFSSACAFLTRIIHESQTRPWDSLHNVL